MSTPLLAYASLHVKLESQQPGGSYKMRGIRAFLESAPDSLRDLEVLSAGNMARSLALACRESGRRVRAFVPEQIPALKRRALEELGAQIETLPFAELWSRVEAPNQNPALLHPIDTVELLRGYGTLAEEILAESPALREVVLPFGVGGLCLGVAFALKRSRPDLHIVVAENRRAAPLSAALAAGKSITLQAGRGWIDAIGTPCVLPRVLRALKSGQVAGLGDLGQPLIDEVRLVDPEQALNVARRFYAETGQVLEGAAAVALGAGLFSAKPAGPFERVVIASGGNFDPKHFKTECRSLEPKAK
jgi:threonine dehydratase